MFQFPAYCPVMTVVMRSPLLERRGFPIRISAGHRVLTARRRISLFAASFIASLCPGILRTPFLPWPCDWFSLVRLSISVLSIFCLQTRCTRPFLSLFDFSISLTSYLLCAESFLNFPFDDHI